MVCKRIHSHGREAAKRVCFAKVNSTLNEDSIQKMSARLGIAYKNWDCLEPRSALKSNEDSRLIPHTDKKSNNLSPILRPPGLAHTIVRLEEPSQSSTGVRSSTISQPSTNTSTASRRDSRSTSTSHGYSTRSRAPPTQSCPNTTLPLDLNTRTNLATKLSNAHESRHHKAYRVSPFSESIRTEGDTVYLGSMMRILVPSIDLQIEREGPRAAWQRLFPGRGPMSEGWRVEMGFENGQWVLK